jgi:DNA-directed RNA polymerase III subunit RPC2
VLTEAQALDYIASKLKSQKNAGKPWQRIAEVKDIFTNVILAHVPMSKNMPFFAKCRYLGLMIRRIIEALHDPAKLDDKDYYGNKRLELAGQLVSLLFEDLFKKF